MGQPQTGARSPLHAGRGSFASAENTHEKKERRAERRKRKTPQETKMGILRSHKHCVDREPRRWGRRRWNRRRGWQRITREKDAAASKARIDEMVERKKKKERRTAPFVTSLLRENSLIKTVSSFGWCKAF